MARIKDLNDRWAFALAAGALTTALVGGVAFGSLQPVAAEQAAVVAPNASPIPHVPGATRTKTVLDALVAKGTISQAQADAILQELAAAKPKTPRGRTAPSIRSYIGELTRLTSTYLGLDDRDLLTQLRAGKSVADLAAARNKSLPDLTALLTKSASEKIDHAVAAKKLTAEQAVALRAKVGAEVTTFLQRKFTKPAPRPLGPVKPSASPKL